MDEEPKCRRCGECVGCDHHWMDALSDPDFSRVENVMIDYLCKHCPAQGVDCNACDEVDFDVDDLADVPVCQACKGSGVVAIDRTPTAS